MDTFDFLIGKYENKKHNVSIDFLIKEAVVKKEQELYGLFIEEIKQLQEKYEKTEKEEW